MIAVIPKAGQSDIVEEFFQLFKTPWEYYREGRAYDVIVATASEIPPVRTKLLILYGPDIKTCDHRFGLTAIKTLARPYLYYCGTQLPAYGEVLIFDPAAGGELCVSAPPGAAGIKTPIEGATLFRIGYDLFAEASFLLGTGQPVERSAVPTLEIHIGMLRDWILGAGLPLLEIPPRPSGHAFAVCLTHDIDFAGIRGHLFDHSMWGFLYRATLGALRDFFRGRIPVSRLLRSWCSAARLPFIYLGWAEDYWLQFEWYLKVEKNLPSTYFMIPFKGRPGEALSAVPMKRRAAAYDILDIPEWTARLMAEGCEIGVHGIDAWHDSEKGREERGRIAAATGQEKIGVRMHWLLFGEDSVRVIEEAGFIYDSTSGYNETIGYRNGTTQVYRPLNAKRLLELPIHIQDGALFFPQRLGLSEREAWERCEGLLRNVRDLGGVLNIIWHDRSPGPERFWGEFYTRFVQALRACGAWFATGGQLVRWFQWRRDTRFEPVALQDGSWGAKVVRSCERINPPLILRFYRPSADEGRDRSSKVDGRMVTDIPWSGEKDVEFDRISGF